MDAELVLTGGSVKCPECEATVPVGDLRLRRTFRAGDRHAVVTAAMLCDLTDHVLTEHPPTRRRR